MILEPRIEPWLDHRRRSVCCESSTPLLTPVRYRRLLDVVEEANHALLEQLRGTFIVVGQAVVGEQVSIAGIEEQLRPRSSQRARARQGGLPRSTRRPPSCGSGVELPAAKSR